MTYMGAEERYGVGKDPFEERRTTKIRKPWYRCISVVYCSSTGKQQAMALRHGKARCIPSFLDNLRQD